MRKVISGITSLMSMLLILFGIVISMCDTADASKQASVMLMGAIIMMVGAGFGFISMGVQDGNR